MRRREFIRLGAAGFASAAMPRAMAATIGRVKFSVVWERLSKQMCSDLLV